MSKKNREIHRDEPKSFFDDIDSIQSPEEEMETISAPVEAPPVIEVAPLAKPVIVKPTRTAVPLKVSKPKRKGQFSKIKDKGIEFLRQ